MSLVAGSLGNDRADSKDSDPISQDTFGLVKGLSLPAEYVDEFRDLRTELSAIRNNRRSLGRAIGDVTCRALGEEIIKIGVRHLQQLRHIIGHGFSAPYKTIDVVIGKIPLARETLKPGKWFCFFLKTINAVVGLSD